MYGEPQLTQLFPRSQSFRNPPLQLNPAAAYAAFTALSLFLSASRADCTHLAFFAWQTWSQLKPPLRPDVTLARIWPRSRTHEIPVVVLGLAGAFEVGARVVGIGLGARVVGRAVGGRVVRGVGAIVGGGVAAVGARVVEPPDWQMLHDLGQNSLA